MLNQSLSLVGKGKEGRKEASKDGGDTNGTSQNSIDSLLKAFKAMETRYASMEDRVEKRFGDLEKVFQSEIDKFYYHVLRKFTETMKTAVTTLKEELGEEIDELTQRVKWLEDKDERGTERMKIDRQIPTVPEQQLNVRNLPEIVYENVKDEVNELLRDGLKLRDVAVESAKRKTNNGNESKHGVIVAKFKSKDDKHRVMKNKNKLKDSKRYENVFIEHDIPKHQRVLNANSRTIVKSDLQFEGSKLRMKPTSPDRPHSHTDSDRRTTRDMSRDRPNRGRGRCDEREYARNRGERRYDPNRKSGRSHNDRYHHHEDDDRRHGHWSTARHHDRGNSENGERNRYSNSRYDNSHNRLSEHGNSRDFRNF